MQEIGLKTDEAESKPLVFKHSYREKAGLATGYRDATPLNHLCDVLTGLIARRMTERLGAANRWRGRQPCRSASAASRS